MGTAYAWKTPFFKTDANIAGAVCKGLEESVGLTAKTLLDASRPEGAPLHDEFEWRDEVAAEKFREQQARVMISNLVIVTVSGETVEPTRAFFTLTESKKANNNYHNVIDVMQSKEGRSVLLGIAMRELKSFRAKYNGLEEFAKVIAAIDELEETT